LSYAASATSTETTAATANLVVGWQPSAGDFFTYTANVTASSYDLATTGSGGMSGCTITLDEDNTRTTSDACGIPSSW
jgi:type IV pilus assembly protein PilE